MDFPSIIKGKAALSSKQTDFQWRVFSGPSRLEARRRQSNKSLLGAGFVMKDKMNRDQSFSDSIGKLLFLNRSLGIKISVFKFDDNKDLCTPPHRKFVFSTALVVSWASGSARVFTKRWLDTTSKCQNSCYDTHVFAQNWFHFDIESNWRILDLCCFD